ncbi:radical SAM protein [Roseisolibacter sp. H3M3-2]|uniref:radical SAM protein n=1 Tax=Roseisolibacter sp. H3M3-2 TaxID=3031323 RepID=UPI0023DAD027|nr:radical SAM protein [Roseisolibacter sp. H3M3-2]MDF1504234.1 radical SAM protein [Roseisolibacter sp. H3M3-2]
MLGPALRRIPGAWDAARRVDAGIERARHGAARVLPVLIRPEPRKIHIAVTANCNQRCVGCRYGRDFMPGAQLPWPVVRDLLDDARAHHIWQIRFYGGEPLLHPDLPRMVAHARERELSPYVTTNAVLLRDRMPALFDAGLRDLTVGFYGVGDAYDAYVQRRGRFARVEDGIAAVRDRYGDRVRLQINWLLSRPSCTVEAFEAAHAFAERYDLAIQVDLVHYSLPYFTEGDDRHLQFRPEDEPAIRAVVAAMLERQRAHPARFTQTADGMRSIPEWLLLGPDMRVPCDSHQMLWVGADGSVQQCYVTFPLGSLHERRLRDLLFTDAHRRAAADSFRLNCPNCHCNYDARVRKHGPSMRRYGADGAAPA